MLRGGVESVDQMAILTPENPKAQKISPQQNAARAEEFEKELAAAGYGFRIVSGMYENPEDSYLVPLDYLGMQSVLPISTVKNHLFTQADKVTAWDDMIWNIPIMKARR